jgi:hypothetical protein
MAQEPEPFSRRFGHRPEEAEITIRNEAPESLRAVLLKEAERVGVGAGELEEIVCKALNKLPSADWSPSYIWNNVVSDIRQCEWFRVYDIIEAVDQHLIQKGWNEAADRFQEAMNANFREAGIGWQLVDGVIEIRGPEAFESSVRGAIVTLEASKKATAQQEFHEALRDLSRRPEPDVTGAVQHAIAALECVARDLSGDSKATLGVLLDKKRISLPPPLDEAATKLWGYACNMARHLKEGRVIAYEEAELLVATASALVTYLTKKAV